MQRSQRPSRHGGGRWSAVQRRSRSVLLRAVPVLALVSVAHAQGPSAFTAEDMSRVASVTVLDVSEDGRRVAAIVRRPLDNETDDHRRYGDPTYLAPAQVTLQIIDTRSGAKDQPFKELVNVRDVAVVAGRPAARDSPRARTVNGGRLSHDHAARVGCRAKGPGRGQPARRRRDRAQLDPRLDSRTAASLCRRAAQSRTRSRGAAARFQALTDGPVIVHTSSEPFLEWDLLQRNTAQPRRSLPSTSGTGAVRAIVPQGKLTSYQPSRDGSFLTVMEDVTAKTDYDTIGGTENALKYVDATDEATAEGRSMPAEASSKGLTAALVRRRRWFAYAKKGEVFVQGVDGAKRAQPDAEAEGRSRDEKATTDDARPARQDDEQGQRDGRIVLAGRRSAATARSCW